MKLSSLPLRMENDKQTFINKTILVMYGKKLTIPGGSQGV